MTDRQGISRWSRIFGGAVALILSAVVTVSTPAQAREDATGEEFIDESEIREFEEASGFDMQRSDSVAEDEINDPFEGANRFFFKVNLTLDRYLLKPVAKAYKWTVPEVIRTAARNMIANLGAPVVFANDLFQLEFERALETGMRFGINSTFGFLGAADVAREMGIQSHTEDFGQTLGVYGVPEGPYLFLPALGPAPPRDLVGRIVDTYMNPLRWVEGNINLNGTAIDPDTLNAATAALAIIDGRAQNLEALDEIERTSIDFYATLRSLYRQSRTVLFAMDGSSSTTYPNWKTSNKPVQPFGSARPFGLARTAVTSRQHEPGKMTPSSGNMGSGRLSVAA